MKWLVAGVLLFAACGKSLGVTDYTVIALRTYTSPTEGKIGGYVVYALGGQSVETRAAPACMTAAVVGQLLPQACR